MNSASEETSRKSSKTSNIARRRNSALADGNPDYTAKREELLKVAGQLFREKGYQATTLADVGRRSGMDRATVYYYFASKETLFRESIKGILDANLSYAEAVRTDAGLSCAERIRRIVRHLMQSYEDNFPHMYVYIQEFMHQVQNDPTPWAHEIRKQTHHFDAIVTALINEGIDRGEFRRDIAARVLANALFGMFNWTHRWFRPDGRHTAEAMSDAFCAVFFDGIQADRR